MQQLSRPEARTLRSKHAAWLEPGDPLPAPERPVRVCFLIDELAPAGTETQLLALIRHLDRRRVWPYLCLLHGGKASSQALEPDCCPILRLQVGSLHHPHTLLQAWRFLRYLRRERIDVLQAYFPDSSYFGIPVAWLAGVKHRLRTRNNVGHWLTPLHRRLGRMLNLLTSRTLVNCEAARQAFLDSDWAHPESVFVLENGIDLERFRDMPPLSPRPSREGLRIGVVANLRPIKGLDGFLRAAADVHRRHPQTRFTIAGEGELRDELTRQAASLGLSACLSLPGSVSDVPSFLAGLDVAVLCSHAEGMSNALLEYMASGRPIVTTAVGAAAELIDDGVHGLLVPPGDARALAEAIQRLLTDRELALRLGEAARDRAFTYYSRASMVRRFEDFYERLLRDEKPNRSHTVAARMQEVAGGGR
jgi:glycosyltransferase involved in cell wall biosynthesis